MKLHKLVKQELSHLVYFHSFACLSKASQATSLIKPTILTKRLVGTFPDWRIALTSRWI
jgi:hypothetical protein